MFLLLADADRATSAVETEAAVSEAAVAEAETAVTEFVADGV